MSRSSGLITGTGLVANITKIAGVSVRETGGTSTVIVKIYDGTGVGGTLVWSVLCLAGGAVGEDMFDALILQSGSCYVEKSGAGTLEMTLRG